MREIRDQWPTGWHNDGTEPSPTRGCYQVDSVLRLTVKWPEASSTRPPADREVVWRVVDSTAGPSPPLRLGLDGWLEKVFVTLPMSHPLLYTQLPYIRWPSLLVAIAHPHLAMTFSFVTPPGAVHGAVYHFGKRAGSVLLKLRAPELMASSSMSCSLAKRRKTCSRLVCARAGTTAGTGGGWRSTPLTRPS